MQHIVAGITRHCLAQSVRGTQTPALALLRFCKVSLQASHKGGSHEDEAVRCAVRCWDRVLSASFSVRRCNTMHYQATLEMQYPQIISNQLLYSHIGSLQSLRVCLNQCSLLMLLSGQRQRPRKCNYLRLKDQRGKWKYPRAWKMLHAFRAYI